ncbi:MAG: tetratricopeptide repeat protein [Bacteroidia bacterium]|nr:tetratricopeptide repeat protein [Bacteroidia bacterium]MDW8301773.1 tetratricopeptide repeat protein [Bacteroidia bacterium]
MKQVFYFIFTISIFWIACQNQKVSAEKQIKLIEDREKMIFGNINQAAAQLPVIDVNAIKDLATQYEQFAYMFPSHEKAPEFLSRAANFYASPNLKMYEKAIFIYDKLVKDYSKTQQAEKACFMKGFIYHNELKKIDKAKAAYEDFLKRYPKSELVPSAQAELQFLGMKPEDLPFLKK